MTSLEIRLLGGFQIVRAGKSVAELPARIQALLANVLLHRNAPRSRQQLAYIFWPENRDKQARTNLRRLLLLLRRALPQIEDILEITPKSVAWQPRIPVVLDLATFEEGLSAAPSDSPQRRDALAAAIDAYRGDLLPDCYDEWILPERERLRNAYAQALAELTLLAETERDYPAAIAYARRLLRHDPLHETSYRRLMRLLALTGDRAGALQTYHTCATLLRREVGVDPSPETQESYARLLHQPSRTETPLAHEQNRYSGQLVGRKAEWQALQRAWRRSSRGAPHWVLITGEAGMGKSRLAEEMSAWAERQGIAITQARSYASTGSVSYSPLIDLLRSDTLRAGWQKLDDIWLVELSRLLPEIQNRRPDLPPPPALAEEWQKRRLFEALGHAFLADNRPLLLVLDDLQWCDRESLDFLAFLLRFRPQARLLVVGTARTVEMLDNGPLQAVIREAAAQGELTQHALAPLTPDETDQLAAQTGGTTLNETTAQHLHDDSGGNPLFVVEMVRAGDWGSETGNGGLETSPPGPTPNRQSPVPSFLPPKIQAVIESRLDQLSSSAQEIAAQAAVLGRSFTYPVLAAASALDEEKLVDGLDELWRRRIIREVSGDGYDFSHDRIRDVAYGVISRAKRRLLHRRAGEALLRVFVGELGPVQGQLGHHFASAGDNPAAIGHFRQAADVALERYAHAEAADYLTTAIALAESAGDAAVYPLLAARERVNRTARRTDEWINDLALLAQAVERLDDGSPDAIRRRADLTLARHYQEYSTGDRNYSLALVQEAVTLARSCSDTTIEAESLVACGLGLWWQGDFDAAQSALAEGYTKAMAVNLFNLAAKSLETQAQVWMFGGGSTAHILGLMAEALVLYEKAGDEVGGGDIRNKLGYLPVAQGVGDYSQALHHLERGLEIGQRIGNRRLEMHILRNLFLLHICQGNYRQAEERAVQVENVTAQLQDKPNRAMLENYQGFSHLQQGRLAEARAMQETASAHLREQQQRLWMVKAITALGWIAFYEGNWQEAERRASEAIAESETFGEERQIAHSLTCRGWARLRLGRVDDAIPDFQRSAEILLRLEMENRAQEPLAGLAQAALQRGDLAAACNQATAVAQHLITHPLDRTTDIFLAIHTCHAILATTGEPLAAEVKALAQTHLQHRAGQIEQEHLDAFWAMPGHAIVTK